MPRFADSSAPRGTWVIGAGFLGSALAERCRAEGLPVLTIGLEREDVRGDASDPAVLRVALNSMKPRLVYCCAATHGGSIGDYRRCYPELVRQVTRVVRESAPDHSVRVVFSSSTSVYGGEDGSAADEMSPCLTAGERAVLLREAETLALEAGGSVARLVPMYAAGRFELLRRHLSREPRLAGTGGRLLNYVHRDDAVSALRLIADAPARIYNVSTECFSLDEAYAMLEALTGLPRCSSQSGASCRGRSSRRVVAEKLARLGWKPRWRVREFVAAQIGHREVES